MGRCHPHLNLDERRRLAKWLDTKIPIKEIADKQHRKLFMKLTVAFALPLYLYLMLYI